MPSKEVAASRSAASISAARSPGLFHDNPCNSRIFAYGLPSRRHVSAPLSMCGNLVQHEPVEAELANGFDEVREIHRLADVAVGAELVSGEHVLLLLGRREDDDRHEAANGICA